MDDHQQVIADRNLVKRLDCAMSAGNVPPEFSAWLERLRQKLTTSPLGSPAKPNWKTRSKKYGTKPHLSLLTTIDRKIAQQVVDAHGVSQSVEQTNRATGRPRLATVSGPLCAGE